MEIVDTLVAHDTAGRALLFFTSLSELEWIDRGVVRAGVAAGAAHEARHCSLGNPFGQGSGDAEVGVIGMRNYHQRPFGALVMRSPGGGIGWVVVVCHCSRIKCLSGDFETAKCTISCVART
jgi:hypothetical protein